MNLLAKLAVAAFLSISTIAWSQIPPDVTLDTVPGVSGLSSALSLKHAGDDSGRLFIVEQGGTVRVVAANGTLLPTPFISLGNLVTTNRSERGLLDLAFHPEFAANGLFYLHYSAGTNRPEGTNLGDTIVAEFSVSTGNPDVANSAPEEIVLAVRQDWPNVGNHNGGGMNFGPDGYLYLGLGDGGSGNDQCNRSQTLDPADIETPLSGCDSATSVALLGKMLRIDVDNSTPDGSNNLCGINLDGPANYAIPDTNPYFDQANRCGEVFFYGLRNPWRWSFDRQTGDLWIGDVGQNTWEEVSMLEWPFTQEENFGWKICEGNFLRGSTDSQETCDLEGSILPVLDYRTGSSFGSSVTGGYRYRGPIRSLQGQYIFGDAVSGNIWFATEDDGSWSFEFFVQPGGSVRSFGEDEQGNLYAVSSSTIRRFNGDIEEIFSDGFES